MTCWVCVASVLGARLHRSDADGALCRYKPHTGKLDTKQENTAAVANRTAKKTADKVLCTRRAVGWTQRSILTPGADVNSPRRVRPPSRHAPASRRPRGARQSSLPAATVPEPPSSLRGVVELRWRIEVLDVPTAVTPNLHAAQPRKCAVRACGVEGSSIAS